MIRVIHDSRRVQTPSLVSWTPSGLELHKCMGSMQISCRPLCRLSDESIPASRHYVRAFLHLSIFANVHTSAGCRGIKRRLLFGRQMYGTTMRQELHTGKCARGKVCSSREGYLM